MTITNIGDRAIYTTEFAYRDPAGGRHDHTFELLVEVTAIDFNSVDLATVEVLTEVDPPAHFKPATAPHRVSIARAALAYYYETGRLREVTP